MSYISNIINQYTIEELVQISEESKSIKEFLQKLGAIKIAGSTYNQAKSILISKGVDYDSLSLRGKMSGINDHRGHVKATPIEHVLVKNSSYSRSSLKKRIIKYKLIPYQCDICGNQGEWNGKKLVLRLDHINGINNDNRLENLRFVCPNCDSQLDTFCARNKAKDTQYLTDGLGAVISTKKSRNTKIDQVKRCQNGICQICGAPTSRGSSLCISCYNKERAKDIPPKEILEEDLKHLPVLQIGLKYSVSDNAVRKWCKKYNLPYTKKDIKIWASGEIGETLGT